MLIRYEQKKYWKKYMYLTVAKILMKFFCQQADELLESTLHFQCIKSLTRPIQMFWPPGTINGLIIFITDM